MRPAWKTQPEPSESDVRDEIMRQLLEIDRTSSICPSDVARALSRLWRERMDLVREVAAEMASEGHIEITQGGRVVDIEQARGPVRIRLKGLVLPVDQVVED